MTPNETCPSCGSTKWRRDLQGEFVCQYGHQYHVLEELGDDEALIGSQNFIRKYKKDKQPRVEKISI
jgi:uncharacterized Zn finger protein (UPF0148 family)